MVLASHAPSRTFNVNGVVVQVDSREEPADERLMESVRAILKENILCSMATKNSDGTPHASVAYYCLDADLSLYLLTQPSTRHSRNIENMPSVALTVFDTSQRWGKPHKGLQIFGSCSRVADEESQPAFDLYSERFPEFSSLVSTAAQMMLKLESRFYRIDPTTIRVIDEGAYGEETHFDIALKEKDIT
jgi:uncharacterized protein YhbP (UPF0306 family)